MTTLWVVTTAMCVWVAMDRPTQSQAEILASTRAQLALMTRLYATAQGEAHNTAIRMHDLQAKCEKPT